MEHLREEGAVEAIGATRRCDEATAHRFLRREAVRRRLALEQIPAAIVAYGHALPEVG